MLKEKTMLNKVELQKAVQDAHKFADDAIAAISEDKKSAKFKNWMQSDIVVKRAYFVTVYVLLFGFIGLELLRY